MQTELLAYFFNFGIFIVHNRKWRKIPLVHPRPVYRVDQDKGRVYFFDYAYALVYVKYLRKRHTDHLDRQVSADRLRRVVKIHSILQHLSKG